MAFLHVLLIVLHVITAAAWFGMAIRLVGQARLVQQLDASPGTLVANDGARAVRLMGIFALLTFVFSMGVLFLGGGYVGQAQYHIASLLIVILVAVQYVLIAPAWKGFSHAAALGDNTDKYRKRLAMGIGTGHLLWLTLVILMFWNRFVPVL